MTFISMYNNELVLEYTDRGDLERKLEYLGFETDEIKSRKKTKGKNEGQEVFYFVLDYVEGIITNIKIDATDWGTELLKVEITDVDEKFVINLRDVFGRVAKDFIRRIDNMDPRMEVKFRVWHMNENETDNGKSYSGVSLYQEDKKIEYALGYEDLPKPEKKKKGRTVEWDYTEQEQFLYETLEAFIDTNFADTEVEEKAPEKPKKEKPKRNSRKKTSKAAAVEGDDDGNEPF